MSIENDHLKLKPFKDEIRPHLTINYFLESLAENTDEKSIGVILSGSGNDGSMGLRAIKEQGGITFAQNEETAQYSQMPHQAIMSGNVDRVLSPEEIANEINRLGKNFTNILKENKEKRDLGNSKIISLIKRKYDIDFSKYKEQTFNRRILRRILLHGYQTINEYYQYLIKNPTEQEELFNDLLINVTEFFRDPEVFDLLISEIYPQVMQNINSEELRIWVPGCSSGEEAYSIAITLLEFLDEQRTTKQIKIFATDINPNSIIAARNGVYPESISVNVSSNRLRKFFNKITGGYEVSKRIRETVIFAEHNVISDPPFANVDIISCRNLLIYLDKDTQEIVIPTFHYALKPSGFLILGKTETIGKFTDYFKVENNTYKIYSKKYVPNPTPILLLPKFKATATDQLEKIRFPQKNTLIRELENEVNKILMKDYTPAGVIINDEYDIIHFQGLTGKYLTNPSGIPAINIIKMTAPLVSIKIQNALMKAKETNKKTIIIENVYDDNGFTKIYDIEIIPLKTKRDNENYYFIAFIDKPDTLLLKNKETEKTLNSTQNEKMYTELIETKEYLQNYMEEAVSYNEELSSANEELQTSYEELQSINEELETTKEELQASNEELTTLNEELQSRNIELNQLYNDMNNLVNSVDIPIVIIDSDLRIRRMTPTVQSLLNIRSIDIGRSIKEINLKIDIPDFENILYDTIEAMSSHDINLMNEEGKWYELKIKPYRTEDRRINGAVLTFINTDYVHLQKRLRKRLDLMMKNIDDAIIIMNDIGDIIEWNQAAAELYDFKEFKIGEKISNEITKERAPDLIKLKDKARLGINFKPINSVKNKDHLINMYPFEDETGLVAEIIFLIKNVGNKGV